jgi:hypothetical protein
MPTEYPPYFLAQDQLLGVLKEVYTKVGDQIASRKYIYHRGAFYADLALALNTMLDLGFSPLIESEYSWRWWADECQKRSDELGADAQYAVKLGDPRPAGDLNIYGSLTLSFDHVVNFMSSIYKGEMDDTNINDLGSVTPAECVKVCQRFVYYILGKHTGQYTGHPVSPWITAVSDELKTIYKQMGEGGSTGGTTPLPPGYVPPFSWPGGN